MNNIYFISGIDTDAGKSYCTAWYAAQLIQKGKRVITQKFIQTGNVGHSEDIDLHRRLMGTGYLPEDREGLTMPEIFSYPASPDLAARIDHREINFERIDRATQELARRYDTVLVEGAGGLMVPLKDEYLTIDYIAERGYPLVFVTSGKLGSVNHTLLSLEAVARRGIRLDTVLYNLYPTLADTTIQQDTQQYLRRYLGRHFPQCRFLTVRQYKVWTKICTFAQHYNETKWKHSHSTQQNNTCWQQPASCSSFKPSTTSPSTTASTCVAVRHGAKNCTSHRSFPRCPSSSALTKKWKICAATCPLSSSRTIRSSKSSSSMTARRVKAKII